MKEMPTAAARRRRRRRIRINNRIRRFASSRKHMLSLAAAMVAVLALLEWIYDFDFSLGILYIFPVVVASTVLTRWQIVAASIFCAYTRGLFTADETHLEHLLRFGMATIAYTGCGLLIYQINDSRRVVLLHYARVRFEQKLRRRAEEQLRLMAESSPAAILTLAADGRILAANRAAHTMFDLREEQSLLQRPIRDFVPFFDDALRLPADLGRIRTSTSTWASRAEGTHFPASAWFSIYGDGEQRRLAAILVDTSNDVREREHAHFEQLTQHNRLLAGAVSHEIRNLCSAIAVVSSNLERHRHLSKDPDFEALKNLVSGLSNMASFDLRNQARMQHPPVQLSSLADELRVIIGQDWEEIGGRLEWHVPASFPPVQAERDGLLQVLLNLSQNALRAAEETDEPCLMIQALDRSGRAVLRITNNGPAIADPSSLFQPFRTASTNGTGLGLYVARAMVKNFGGELHHVPTAVGATFELTLRFAASGSIEHDEATEVEA